MSQRDEYHAAARAEKSVDKARGETREQTFPEGDVFLFHKKYLRSPVWAAEAVFMPGFDYLWVKRMPKDCSV